MHVQEHSHFDVDITAIVKAREKQNNCIVYFFCIFLKLEIKLLIDWVFFLMNIIL